MPSTNWSTNTTTSPYPRSSDQKLKSLFRALNVYKGKADTNLPVLELFLDCAICVTESKNAKMQGLSFSALIKALTIWKIESVSSPGAPSGQLHPLLREVLSERVRPHSQSDPAAAVRRRRVPSQALLGRELQNGWLTSSWKCRSWCSRTRAT